MTKDRYRPLAAAAVLLVAAIAAVVSCLHIVRLALAYGQEPLAAYLLPLSIDGMVATSSLVMLRAAPATRRPGTRAARSMPRHEHVVQPGHEHLVQVGHNAPRRDRTWRQPRWTSWPASRGSAAPGLSGNSARHHAPASDCSRA